MPGVRNAKVDYDNKEALVEFDANKATIDAMSAALAKAGYKGSLKSWPEGLARAARSYSEVPSY